MVDATLNRSLGKHFKSAIIKFKQGDTKMTNSGKILVTGATGNVGSVLIPNLASLGADVRAMVRWAVISLGIVFHVALLTVQLRHFRRVLHR